MHMLRYWYLQEWRSYIAHNIGLYVSIVLFCKLSYFFIRKPARRIRFRNTLLITIRLLKFRAGVQSRIARVTMLNTRA